MKKRVMGIGQCWPQIIIMKLVLKYVQAFSKKANKGRPEISPAALAQFTSQRATHIPNHSLPCSQRRNILITSALPYVNNTPHLGNIIGAVLSADVYARFCRLMGHNVLYICGTDEYGTATEVKALKQGSSPRAICDHFHTLHKSIYEWFGISFDHFGRTSTPAHTAITQQIFTHLRDNGALEEKTTQQLHCGHCDLFLADRFVLGNCKKCGSATRGDQCESCSTIFNNPAEEITALSCSVCGNAPSPRQTTHFYLKLAAQSGVLKEWLLGEGGMDGWSNNAKGVTRSWLNSPAEDRCITRDLKWGVPVPHPGYEKKVFYVWFEAPIGYISMAAAILPQEYKQWWMPSSAKPVQLRQFMGKDNILFHSIIHPATLTATRQPWIRPTQLAVTEYLRYEGGKFSKSHGVGVFGDQCQQTDIDVDSWRYYLLRVRPESFDSEFSWADFAQKNNKELLNSIGNVAQRVLKFSHKSYGPKILPLALADLSQDELHVIREFSAKIQQFVNVMEKTQLLQGTNLLCEFADCLNQYVGKVEFWKSPRKQIQLAFLTRMLRVYTLILEPFVPTLATRLNYLLGMHQAPSVRYPQLKDLQGFMLSCLEQSQGLKEPVPLVTEISNDQLTALKSRFGPHS